MAPPGIDHERNPLGFVDKLLKEERDSNLHFGDVRFWKHLEYIDTAQIYRTKSLEYRTMKLMFCECIFYVIFLGSLMGFILNTRSHFLFEARRQGMDYWAGCQRSADGVRGEGSCSTDRVINTSALMTWMREDFVPSVFTDAEIYEPIASATSMFFRLQDGTTAWKPRYVGDTKASVLVGSIRIRQLRVQYNKDCVVKTDLQVITPDCFPPYSPGSESKKSWAPTWTPEHLEHHYDWYDSNYTDQTPMNGHHGTYPGTGFMFDLPLNRSGAQMRLLELIQWDWLDFRTRAVIIELTTLTPNVNIFVHHRLLFEFPATGGSTFKQDAVAFNTYQLSLPLLRSDHFPAFVSLCITFALHCSLALYMLGLMYQNLSRYFTYFWSWVDMMIVFIFFVHISIVFDIMGKAALIPNLRPEVLADPEMFYPVGYFTPSMELAANAVAILGMLAWFKILKYFTLSITFQPFVRVIERCIVNLLLFSGLLFVVIFGFATAFYIGYGSEDNIFATHFGALLACFVLPTGGVDLSPLFSKGDALGPVLVVAYVIIIFLLLMNTFLAICIDTYSVCTFELAEVQRVTKANPFGTFLTTYFNALRGFKLVGKETEEEKGKPDEQAIALSSLPEAVASRWLETKQKMEDVLALAQMQMLEAKLESMRARGLLEDEPPSTPGAAKLRALGAAEGDMLALEDNKSKALALEDRKLQAITNGQTNGHTNGYTNGHTNGHTNGYTNGYTNGHSPNGDGAHVGFETAGPQQGPTEHTVSRIQLQRMLDDDPGLRDICGTDKALDLMRRFRVDQAGTDPFEAVANLQAAVIKKLEGLQDHGTDLSFDEVETLKNVAQELHSALTEAQKEWRGEVLSVLQMASLLSKSLIDLTRKLEALQRNHNQLAVRARPDG